MEDVAPDGAWTRPDWQSPPPVHPDDVPSEEEESHPQVDPWGTEAQAGPDVGEGQESEELEESDFDYSAVMGLQRDDGVSVKEEEVGTLEASFSRPRLRLKLLLKLNNAKSMKKQEASHFQPLRSRLLLEPSKAAAKEVFQG